MIASNVEGRKVAARDLKAGTLFAPMGGKTFFITHSRRSRRYEGFQQVQYANPEVPGGIVQQEFKLAETFETFTFFEMSP